MSNYETTREQLHRRCAQGHRLVNISRWRVFGTMRLKVYGVEWCENDDCPATPRPF